MKNRFASNLALALILLAGASRASAAPLIVVTPGEQNTKSGENGCGTAPCAPAGCAAVTCGGNNWHHYPELLSIALGSGYVVNNTGDGGAILGCDAASAAIANGQSFCTSGQYTNFTNPAPDIVIIGPFGEHDQRILAGNAMFTAFYTEAAFEAAYDGLIKKYIALKSTVKIYMMTPIDVTFSANALPGGKDIVKDVMLAASKAAAMKNNVPIIDTNAMVGMSYYATDGQVNAAGQMKMAQMIEAALMNGGGTDGGAGGSGGASGAAGSGTDAGAAGGTTGTGGSTSTTGTAGATGTTTGTAGATGTTTGTAGATGTTTGTAGATGTTTGTAGATGTTTGTAGAGTTTGTGTGSAGAAGAGPYGKGSSGCAVASPSTGGALGLAALGMLAAVVFGRRRRR